MDRPPREPNQLIVTDKDWLTIFLYALAMTIGVIAAVIFCKLTISDDIKVANNVGFLTLALIQIS